MNWYDKAIEKTAGIIINPNGPYEAELVSTGDSQRFFTEISWDDGSESINTLTISVLAANQGGFLYNANHVVVQMRFPPVTEVDKQIMSNIQAYLGNLTQTPYSEGRDSFLQAIESVSDAPLDVDDKGNIYQVPQEGEQGLVEQGGPTGMTLHTSTLLGVYGPFPDSQDSVVKMIIANIRKIIQPMLDANLLEFVEVQSKIVGNDMIRSQAGQQKEDDTQVAWARDVGYFYYVIDTVLSPYPALYKRYGGAAKDYGQDIVPQNKEKIDLTQSQAVNYIIDYTSNNGFDKQVWDAVIQFNTDFLDKAEQQMVSANEGSVSTDLAGTVIARFSDREEFEKELDSVKHGLSYIYEIALKPEMIQYLNDIGLGSQIDRYIDVASEKAIDELQNYSQTGEMDRYYLTRMLLPFKDSLKIPVNILSVLDQWQSQVEEENSASEEEERKARRERSFQIDWDIAVVNFEDGTIHKTDIDSNRYGYDEIGEWLLEKGNIPLDEDAILMMADELASDEAWEDVQSRPSESYEDDDKEILSDIKYEADDFLDEQDDGVWSNFPDPNNPTDEQMASFVVNMMKDEFIKWKKQKLEEEEEMESWKYEPDNESTEYHIAVYGKKTELALGSIMPQGYGVIHLDWERDQIEIEGYSQFEGGMRKILFELASRNMADRYSDDENPFALMPQMQVSAVFHDQKDPDSNIGTIQDWGTIAQFKSATAWYRQFKFGTKGF